MQGLSLAAHIQGRVVRRLFAIEDGSGRDKKIQEQDFKWTVVSAKKRGLFFRPAQTGCHYHYILYICVTN